MAGMTRIGARGAVVVAAVALAGVGLAARQMPPANVRFTPAREHEMRRSVRLPGTVHASTVSVVASEVAGLVEALAVREGTSVRKGDVLARLRTDNRALLLQSAKGEAAEAQARQELAQRELQRAKDLFDQQIYSQQQLDAAAFELNARQGKLDQLKATIARLEDEIERSVIRAPFAGVVVQKHTEVGQWLTIGGAVLELQGVDLLEVVVEVPDRYFASIRRGGRVPIEIDGVAGPLEGEVFALVPRASDQARTFPVKVRVANKGGRIAPGMLASVSFPVGDAYRATIVPKDALVVQGPQRVVFVIGDDNTASPVPVQTGASVGEWVSVEGPIKAGTKVITRGNERLAPGQAVAGQALEYKAP